MVEASHGLTADTLVAVVVGLMGWFTKVGYDRFRAVKPNESAAEHDYEKLEADLQQLIRISGSIYRIQRQMALKAGVDTAALPTDAKDL